MPGCLRADRSGVRRLLWPVSVALATAGGDRGRTARGGARLRPAARRRGRRPGHDRHGRRGRHRRARRARAARADQVGGAGVAPRAVRDQPAHRRVGRAAPADRRAAAPGRRGDADRAGQPAHRDLADDASGGGLSRSVTLGVTDEAPAVLRARPHGHLADRGRRRGLGAALAAAARRRPAIRYDRRRAPLRVAAITDSGELLGMVVVGRRPGAPRYDFDDDDSLGGGLPAARGDRAQPAADLRARGEPRRPAGHQRPVAALAHAHRHRRRRRAAPHRTQPARRRAAASARAGRHGRPGAPDGHRTRIARRDRGDARPARRRRARRDRRRCASSRRASIRRC